LSVRGGGGGVSVIYLVRHGQASFGAADYDVLSDLGYRQAALAGAELRNRGVRVDLAVSGTLRRQRETAATALAVLGGAPIDGQPVLADDSVEPDARWNEYDQDWIIDQRARAALAKAADDGETPGAVEPPASQRLSTREFQNRLDPSLRDWASGTGGGPGSFHAFSDGIGTALSGILDRLGSGGTAVVFTSAGPVAALVARLLAVGPDGFVSLNRTMINGGITKVVSGRSGTSLISINEHSHIDAAGREYLSYR
jgi:broad specificity phosphatase PhoE